MTLTENRLEPDLDLIRQIARGEEAALRGLYAAYGQALYAYALRLTRDPATAEEAVQESLVAVWQGAGRFRGDSRILTWLLGIVYHKSLNLLRRREDLHLEEETRDLPAKEDSPGRQMEIKDRARVIHGAMEKLPFDQRAVVDLVFFHHLSMEEAGQVLDCPAGTVKSRLFAARNNLKGILVREGLKLEDLL
jgi:RNA polymerase sigma-70 factor (ECF subfamily)